LKPAGAKSSARPYLEKNPSQKRSGGAAQTLVQTLVLQKKKKNPNFQKWNLWGLCAMTHTYNPVYSEGRDWRDNSLRPAQEKADKTPS
jgi:hypothetical protein